MELTLGTIAGALAQIFTIPVSICTTHQQTQFGEERKSLIATAKEIIHEDGITDLWRGLKPSLILVINPAITYGLFERFKEGMYPGMAWLIPGQSFFVGAASMTVATIITYPYIMVKVRMQFKSPMNQGDAEVEDNRHTPTSRVIVIYDLILVIYHHIHNTIEQTSNAACISHCHCHLTDPCYPSDTCNYCHIFPPIGILTPFKSFI